MVKRIAPPLEELKALYQQEGETLSSVAQKYGVSHPTVRKWLKGYKIPIKSHLQASQEANKKNARKKPSKELLERLYVKKGLSIKSIENILNTGQSKIYEWLDEYQIEKRSLSESCRIAKQKQYEDIQFDPETVWLALEEVSHNKKVAAQNLGISLSHLKSLIDRYGIETKKYIDYKSQAERDILDFCQSSRPDLEWVSGDKSQINPFEIDIYCPSLNLAIEYCGMYWHSEFWGRKERSYHQKKWKLCRDKGIELITIFESDDMDKVRSLLKKKLGQTKRVFARKTKLKKIDARIAREFHDTHHLNNSVGSEVNYGLFFEDQLVQVASFCRYRFSDKHDWECSRATSHSEFAVVGGMSKLFKAFFNEISPQSLVTFADLRFGWGGVYQKCGLKEKGVTSPNYWYFQKNNPYQVYSRVAFQKHKIKEKLPRFEEELTEFENMKMNGWDRIWDCGSAKYAL